MRLVFASIAALALSAPAFATPTEDFRELIADYEAFTAERDLGARARQGDLEAAASWPDMSVEAIEAWDSGMAGFDDRSRTATCEHRRQRAKVEPRLLAQTAMTSHAVLCEYRQYIAFQEPFFRADKRRT